MAAENGGGGANLGGEAREAADKARAAAREAADKARGTAREAAEKARHTARDVAHEVREVAHDVEERLDGMRGYADDAGEWVRTLARERPMVALGLAVGVGFVVGRLLSRT